MYVEQLNNKQSSAVEGRMQTLNYKKLLLTMKPVVTQVDATEQNRKNRVACSFCMNERRSCDAKTTEVLWIKAV